MNDLRDLYWVCLAGLAAVAFFALVVLITGAGNTP